MFFNKTSSKPLFILSKNVCRYMTEMKSSWLLMREARNAVCGVVESSSAEILRVFFHLILF